MHNQNVRAGTGACGIDTALVQTQGRCCAAADILVIEFIRCATLEVRIDPKNHQGDSTSFEDQFIACARMSGRDSTGWSGAAWTRGARILLQLRRQSLHLVRSRPSPPAVGSP